MVDKKYKIQNTNNMDKKTALFLIIAMLILTGVVYEAGMKSGFEKFSPATSQEFKIPSGNTSLQKMLSSNTIDISASTNGTIKNISDNSIALEKSFEDGTSKTFSIPITKGISITTKYILPDNASTDKVVGTIKDKNGKSLKLGERNISLEKVKIGDNALVSLKILPDSTVEGTSLDIWPANLLD